jgi:hypothetical protein
MFNSAIRCYHTNSTTHSLAIYQRAKLLQDIANELKLDPILCRDSKWANLISLKGREFTKWKRNKLHDIVNDLHRDISTWQRWRFGNFQSHRLWLNVELRRNWIDWIFNRLNLVSSYNPSSKTDPKCSESYKTIYSRYGVYKTNDLQNQSQQNSKTESNPNPSPNPNPNSIMVNPGSNFPRYSSIYFFSARSWRQRRGYLFSRFFALKIEGTSDRGCAIHVEKYRIQWWTRYNFLRGIFV